MKGCNVGHCASNISRKYVICSCHMPYLLYQNAVEALPSSHQGFGRCEEALLLCCSCGVKHKQIDEVKTVKHRRGASLGIATWWQSGTHFEVKSVFRSSTCFRSWTGKQRRGPRIGRPQCLRREKNPRNCETTHGGVEPTWTTTFELLGIGRSRFINLRASPSEPTAMETEICCTRARCVHFRTRPASAISMRLSAWRLEVKDQEQRNTEIWIDVTCTLSPSLPASVCLFVSLSLSYLSLSLSLVAVS